MFSVPVALPPTTGANATNTSQCVPGAITPFQLPLATQSFWEMAKGPMLVTLLSDAPTEPVLVTWTLCAALVVPTVTESIAMLVGDTETDGRLDTVIVTGADVAALPAASLATAVRVCAALVAAVVSQEVA